MQWKTASTERDEACVYIPWMLCGKASDFYAILIVIHLELVHKHVKPKTYLLYYSLKKAEFSMILYLLLILYFKK